MLKRCLIKEVKGREILDSRGNPTTEAVVVLEDGSVGVGAAPSGASTGRFEAAELRDGEPGRYGGKGVRRAVANIEGPIASVLCGMDAEDTYGVDAALCAADGTGDKRNLGANAILSASIACARAAAISCEIPLYRFLGGTNARVLPVPMMNILNGGAHAGNPLDVQEFMIIPVGAGDFAAALRRCAEVYHALGKTLHENGFSVGVGDEGGYAPEVEDETRALELLRLPFARRRVQRQHEIRAGLVARAVDRLEEQLKGEYRLPKSEEAMNREGLIERWAKLIHSYPILSIEAGLGEEDWTGWQALTERLGGRVQLVGDDLFVSNPARVQKGVELGCANAVLIKPNQIGTLSEAMSTVRLAQESGFAAVISHRSGETEDTLIADLAVALNAGQIKSGAPARGERTAKYNRLLCIEGELGYAARYPGTLR